jgi:hypothetical protein
MKLEQGENQEVPAPLYFEHFILRQKAPDVQPTVRKRTFQCGRT